MDISKLKEGTLVRFKYPENGYPSQIDQAQRFLEENKVYTVDFVEIYDWHTDIVLREFPGESFNSVMFETAP